MAIHFDIIRDGREYSARPDNGAAFPLAARVRYSPKHEVENYGLTNVGGHFGSTEAKKHIYEAADYVGTYSYWADFIEPTALCEGQSFLSLNSYDRARFTFGFAQFAAHVPDGDFIRWFRDMLLRPEAQDYFPNFEIRDGRVFKLEALSATQMETSQSTEPLMHYFNPSLGEVEDAEVIAAAKFVHWTVNHAGARLLQVQHMINTARRLVREADNRLNLDGQTGDICCVIMDIRHQGRARYSEMQEALLSGNPFAALLDVGCSSQQGRCQNLKSAMATRRAGLKRKKWSRAAGDFV